MNKIDLIILFIVLISMLIGYYRGLVKSVLSVIQYFAVIFLSIYFSPILSSFLIEKFNLDLVIIDWIKNNENLFSDTISIISEDILSGFASRIINVLMVIVLFIVLKLVFSIIITVLNKVANLPILSLVNKLGGLVLGAVNGLLIVYLLIVLVKWLPIDSLNGVRNGIDSSVLGVTISAYAPVVATEVINIIPKVTN